MWKPRWEMRLLESERTVEEVRSGQIVGGIMTRLLLSSEAPRLAANTRHTSK